VRGADLVVKDELRPDGTERIPGLLVEIMAFGRGDGFRLAHL